MGLTLTFWVFYFDFEGEWHNILASRLASYQTKQPAELSRQFKPHGRFDVQSREQRRSVLSIIPSRHHIRPQPEYQVEVIGMTYEAGMIQLIRIVPDPIMRLPWISRV